MTDRFEMTWDSAVLSHDLGDAIRRREFLTHYQPQFDLRTSRLVSVEALVRWDHPELGMVPPSAFIELAEREGRIGDICSAVFEDALRRARLWLDGGLPLEVSVNVSPTQLGDEFASEVLEACRVSGLRSGTLTIEITESVDFGDLAEVLPCLERLRANGIGVSMDDFGAGATSIEYLDELPFSELKIDRSLVQSETRAAADTISEAVAFGRERGCRIVAEGIETPEQLERAKSLGCDRGQGFLLAAPMASEGVDRLLADA